MGEATRLVFNGDAQADTLNRRVRPSDEQLELLRERKGDLEDYLRRDVRARSGAPVSTWLQGSYKLHTLVRPLNKQDFDVDLGLYVEWDSRDGQLHSPSELRSIVEESLLAFSYAEPKVREIEDPPKERCSRVNYGEQFHVDVPVYHFEPRTQATRLATLSNGWEDSDPEKMVRWFQARLDGDDRAQVRRIVRYLKAWAALRFATNRECQPSSLVLTVLAVNAFLRIEGALDDEDALRAVIDDIFWTLSASRHVTNPVQTDGDNNINRMSEAGFDGFMQALAGLTDVARRAAESDSEADAAAIWSEEFSYLFPLPDIAGLVEENDGGRALVVNTPRIRIEIMPSREGRIDRVYDGQVELVRVNEWLRFRVLNPGDLPPGAQVRWVVRNVGEKALSKNDLGHVVVDNGTLSHVESAAYHGRHFMDCEVRVRGQLHSITRVPVAVSATQVPPRHPVRAPAYARFRRRR